MKKLLTKLKPLSLNSQAGQLALLGFLFFAGALAGSLSVSGLKGQPLANLTDAFAALLERCGSGQALTVPLWPSVRNALLFPAIIYLGSFTPLTLLITPVAIGAKGFLTAITVTAFTKTLGLQGLWLAVAAVGVQTLIVLPLLMLLSLDAWRNGLRLTTAALHRQPPAPPDRAPVAALALLTLVFALTALYEVYAMPTLMSWLVLQI